MAHDHAYLICENKCLVESRPVKTAVVTLASTGWSNKAQTVNVTGMTSDCFATVIPDVASQDDWVNCGVKATTQGNGTVTFTCATVPDNNITVGIQMTF